MKDVILLMVSATLVNNVVLARFLGLCSFMGVTTKVDTAIGMGMATTFVITVSSMGDWALETFLLAPFDLRYLRTVTFILVIAAAVQFTEMVIRKMSPALFRTLGIYLPLITTNCAVLGVALLLVEGRYGFVDSTLFAFASSLGYSLVMVVFVVLGLLFTRQILGLLGSRVGGAEIELAVRMTHLILPAQLFFYWGALLMAVQFAQKRFFVPALAPLFYNGGIIVGDRKSVV